MTTPMTTFRKAVERFQDEGGPVYRTWWLQLDGNTEAMDVLTAKVGWLNYADPEAQPFRVLEDVENEDQVSDDVANSTNGTVAMLTGTLTVPDWTNAEQVEGALWDGGITALFS